MAEAIRYTGDNARDVSMFITPEPHGPFELKGGVWLKQLYSQRIFRLVIPAREGEVDLAPGDYVVREDGLPGVIRLNLTQMRAEYPELMQ